MRPPIPVSNIAFSNKNARMWIDRAWLMPLMGKQKPSNHFVLWNSCAGHRSLPCYPWAESPPPGTRQQQQQHNGQDTHIHAFTVSTLLLSLHLAARSAHCKTSFPPLSPHRPFRFLHVVCRGEQLICLDSLGYPLPYR